MLKIILENSPLLYLVQSFWRDEAFSVLVAEKSVWTFFTKLSFEPPVYYILLHFWMKIFGEGEIAVRSLSFLGLILATVIVIFWAEKIFRKSWLSWFLPVFFFTNPMLIYYGFEVRTYGWYIFFATFSMYAYLTGKWKWYIFSAIGGFYTHTYFLFTIAVQVVHYLAYNGTRLFKKPSVKKLLSDPAVRSFTISGLVILPWLIRVLIMSSKLKSSWYFPVNFNLIRSVLGNMFLGYEGTPWYLWKYTAVLSLVLLMFFIYAIINPKTRKFNLYFFLNVMIPLSVVIGISFIKPLFVNRYLLSVTVAEIFLIALSLREIKNSAVQVILGIVILASSFWFNAWYPSRHAKIPYRQIMNQVNAVRGKDDYVYATSSLNFFETVYYSKNRSGVFFYSPSGSPFPWYVGEAIFDQSQMAFGLPQYPARAIMVTPEGKISIAYEIQANPVSVPGAQYNKPQ